MAITIGLTGGIGSGKSTVSNVFRLLGVPVFEADQSARELMNTDAELIKGLIELFGPSIYKEDKLLDRKKLAGLIFCNDPLLEKVNRLVHPAVRKSFSKWKDDQTAPYSIHEAAILFESGFCRMMDFTILVSAPEEMRIRRVSERDNLSIEEIRNRMAKQWSDDEKRKLADIELINDNKSLIIPQIIEIDKKLRTNGKIW